MKAWILHNPNNMTYEETEKPQPKSDEVLVAVKAAGICGSDIPRAFVTGAHVHPIIIGHEFAGQVCACGTDVGRADRVRRNSTRCAGIIIILAPGVMAVLRSMWQCRRRTCLSCRRA